MKIVFGCRVDSSVTAELEIPDTIVSVEDKLEFIWQNFDKAKVISCEPDSFLWSTEDIFISDKEEYY